MILFQSLIIFKKPLEKRGLFNLKPDLLIKNL